jgi:hypothetical protein
MQGAVFNVVSQAVSPEVRTPTREIPPTRGDEMRPENTKTSSRDFQDSTGYGDRLCHIIVSSGPKSRLAGTMGNPSARSVRMRR